MWIFDSAYRDGGIDLWTKDGTVTKVHHAYAPPFSVHFHDPDAHHEMIEVLTERYDAKECTIRTIFGEIPGYEVCAGRDIAEAIEKQAQFDVEIFNVDVRRDQRFMAEQRIFPCAGEYDDRFSPVIEHDLSILEIHLKEDPGISTHMEIEVVHESKDSLTGPTCDVLTDLFSLIVTLDPDVVLMPNADTLIPKIRNMARDHGLVMPFSRNGKYRQMDSPFQTIPRSLPDNHH